MRFEWRGRRLHCGLRVLEGPLGLGVRFLVWKQTPDTMIANLDILTPLFDVQVGVHTKDRSDNIRA